MRTDPFRSIGRIMGIWKDYSVDRIGVVGDGFLGRRTIYADQRGVRGKYQPIFIVTTVEIS
jgi:hypothetical protein